MRNFFLMSSVFVFMGMTILFSMGTSGGCGPEATTCDYNGNFYDNGASFPSKDGCNTCTCTNGQVACTEKACAKAGCKQGTQEYKHGESFPASDGCNSCSCEDGSIRCTKKLCDTVCGSRGSAKCLDKQYCAFPDGTCGAADKGGLCQLVPETCPSNVDPVCGCDGKTYNNSCAAASQKVSVKAKGACSTKPKTCDYEGKTYEDGDSWKAKDGCNTCTCSDGNVGCTKKACLPPKKDCTFEGKTHKDGASFESKDGCQACTCSSGKVECKKKSCTHKVCGGKKKVQCAKDEVCLFKDGVCGANDAEGTCEKVTKNCPTEKKEVCGCDGKTYDNACLAKVAGTSVQHTGICKTTEKPCGGIAGFMCKGKDEFCSHKEGTCKTSDRMGVCKQKPQGCTTHVDPVCGCDGKTYNNSCEAAAKGMSVDHKGACGKGSKECVHQGKKFKDGSKFTAADGCNICTCSNGGVSCTRKLCPNSCGAKTGKTCASSKYCKFSNNSCGKDGFAGQCKEKPQNCATIHDPVCGCDGKDYSNECSAWMAGTSMAKKGKCKP